MQSQTLPGHSMQLRPRPTRTETQWTGGGQVLGGRKAKKSRLVKDEIGQARGGPEQGEERSAAPGAKMAQRLKQRLREAVEEHPFMYAAITAAIVASLAFMVVLAAQKPRSRRLPELEADDVHTVVKTVFCPRARGGVGVQPCRVTYTRDDGGLWQALETNVM
ncbi:hypothetical protein AC578_4358 [Pseudocercospora eumusae]|uniref:Uncharacterized protein n=1 Tax=Pseudocercospora eumusae TaxID=321146 RepID=A0A139H5P5_9PEZI|nr:hypothetical protein AC578_4358 [Pseudocercospora eumusae]